MPPKAPQDHKPKKSAVERELDDFVYDKNGHRVVLPPPSKIKAGVIRRAAKLSDGVQQVFSIFEDIADEDSLAAMDDMTLDELSDLFSEWQSHGGASLGESRSSSS